MSFLSVIFLAIGLAMDAFAVSITGGIVSTSVTFLYAFRIAIFFAVFQMLMPWLGWWNYINFYWCTGVNSTHLLNSILMYNKFNIPEKVIWLF